MKYLILLIFAPEFLRRMPRQDNNFYYAIACTQSPWYEATKFKEKIKGRRSAYIKARWEALKLDWNPRYSHPEIGIVYCVTNKGIEE